MALAEDVILRILANQGYRELVSAHLFAGAVPFAPTIDDKHMLADHAREELGHFEVVASLYDELSGRPLHDVASARASLIPLPKSWLEAAVAGYLVDRAAAVQLAEYAKLGDPRLARVAAEILEHEHEHLAAAETALLDQTWADPEVRRSAEPHVARWYAIALELFDEGEGSVQVAFAFADSLRSTMTECGFSMPVLPAH